MRRLLPVLVLVVASCAPVVSGATTTSTPKSPPTTETVTTATSPSLSYEVTDCAAPQVTFAPLCETYEILQEWHVDRPIAPRVLADAALAGLRDWTTDEVEEHPRTLFCAIPDPAFQPFCAELAARVDSASIPVGPAVEAALLAMTNTPLGPFTYYLPPDEVGALRENGVVTGVGILLDATDAVGSKCARLSPVCELRVVYVLEDNPGAAAGIEPDDVIVAVDGEPVEGKGFVDTATLIAGDETGVVSLRIDRDGDIIDLDIERAELVVPTVEIDVPSPGVGYIRIPDFEDDIPVLISDGLDALLEEPLDTIVIDLRDNAGGFIDVAVEVISEFVAEGTVFRTVGPGENERYEAVPGGVATTQDLIVLVNEGTASAAEIMAAALRDARQAPIVGTTTFGKDAVQITFDLHNGGEVYVTVARWLSPNDTTVSDGGLEPDHAVELPAALPPAQLVEMALEAVR